MRSNVDKGVRTVELKDAELAADLAEGTHTTQSNSHCSQWPRPTLP